MLTINGHMVLNWQPDSKITILSRITCSLAFPLSYFVFMVLHIDIYIFSLIRDNIFKNKEIVKDIVNFF